MRKDKLLEFVFGLVVLSLVVAACSSSTSTTTAQVTTSTTAQVTTSTTVQVTTSTAGTQVTTTTAARQPVASLTIAEENFPKSFCRPALAGPIFDDILVAACWSKEGLRSPGTRALQMYDLGDSGGQKWIISPESEQQRLSSFGVGQTIVAALRETDTAASGLSSASTRYEVVIYDKVTGREVAVAFDEEIATADIRAEPEIVAVSISDTVFVTWPFVWDHSDAVTRAFSRDGSQLWSIESLALGDSNQHFAVFSSGSIEGVIHLDSSREIAHDIVGDFYRYPSFNACSSRVFGIGEGNAHYVVDAVSGARIDTTERIKAVAPLGAYFGPSEESPSIRYEALGPEETRTVWETPADTSIFKDWLVEGGVVIIGTYSAGEQAVDPFTGVVSAYDGSIRVPGNQWKVFPDWVVDITGLTVEPNRLASDCPVFQVPFTAADSFPVFSP